METITDKINEVIKRHFNRYFKSQYIEPNQNEWSALRRSMKKLVKEELVAYSEWLHPNHDKETHKQIIEVFLKNRSNY